MTRYARAGSTQKRVRQPFDSTKWGEFPPLKSRDRKEGKFKDGKVAKGSNNKKVNRKPDKFPEPVGGGIKVNENIIAESDGVERKHLNDVIENNSLSILNAEHCDSNEVHSDADVNEGKTSKEAIQKRKRNEMFLEKRKQNRLAKGLIFLPPNIEDKIYRMKKKLRQKGVSGDKIQEIVRSERRKEEQKLKHCNKICFNCRENGHVLADCPKIAADDEQGTGICFKCGSTEHKSFECTVKIKDFPFAKCFICQNKGHLSRNCPENKLGIYPKGGQCDLCGNVNHLKKDCPTISKNKGCEVELTLDTVDGASSMDAEFVEAKPVAVRQKKAKVVKF